MFFRRSRCTSSFSFLAVAASAVLAAMTALPAEAQPHSFTHLAGSLGGPGFTDGKGGTATFYAPMGVAVDGAGNVYVVDTGNSAIRKITPFGTVTTLAGSGTRGSADGAGTAASFFYPMGVAVDGSGNVYVADMENCKIRKVTPGGFVSTLAGSGGVGSADGPGAAATFTGPYGVAVDAGGNVYVADTLNQKIRKVTPAGVVSTLAGSGAVGSADGTGTAAAFRGPSSVAVDAAGNVYVADSGNHKIRKVAPGGVVTTLAGSGAPGSADGTGTAASFRSPAGVAVEASGSVLVADRGNDLIRRVTPAGAVTTVAGTGSAGCTDATGTAASFNDPEGVAADAVGGAFVADSSNHRIRKISAGGAVTTLAGSGSFGAVDGAAMASSFALPGGLAVDGAGNVTVADLGNHKIRRITAGGAVTTLAGSGKAGSADGTGAAAAFDEPGGVALDGAGNVYVADTNNHKIRKITTVGAVTTLAGSGTGGSADGTGTAASFYYPAGLAIDAAGTVYVADTYNNRIRKVTAAGVVTTLAGSGAQGSADGVGAAASFYYPQSVAVDAAGILRVADTYNHKIRRIRPDGTVTTEAGTGAIGFADGPGNAATFSFPSAVVVDGSGIAYVADGMNNAIRSISPLRVVSTIGGSGAMGHQDGTGRMATFARPLGIARGSNGALYVSDGANNAIRLGRTTGSATCSPGDETLCLLGGRFRVTAEYRDYGGGHGTGKAVPLTADTGTFWFFDPANLETVVKMVSFCGSGSNNVAVYAGGLTDLDVTLHVTDTRIGTARDYRNPLGTGFTLIRDGPYACPAAAETGGEPGLEAPVAPGTALIEETTIRTVAAPGASAACAPDGTTLCLLGGRFRVTAAYRDYGGGSGAGQAVPLTTDTGTFWFFSAANVETVVKMVSFCGEGSNNVGIYAGGLTDVEVTLTVTDLRSGLVKSYTNALGSPFRLIRDGPFPCP